MYRMCTAMLLRAYALTVGLRKDRNVLITVVVMTRQAKWDLRRTVAQLWVRSGGRSWRMKPGHLVAKVDEKKGRALGKTPEFPR
jgi:hypothetical protein